MSHDQSTHHIISELYLHPFKYKYKYISIIYVHSIVRVHAIHVQKRSTNTSTYNYILHEPATATKMMYNYNSGRHYSYVWYALLPIRKEAFIILCTIIDHILCSYSDIEILIPLNYGMYFQLSTCTYQ
jgi:hypothetical protein